MKPSLALFPLKYHKNSLYKPTKQFINPFSKTIHKPNNKKNFLTKHKFNLEKIYQQDNYK